MSRTDWMLAGVALSFALVVGIGSAVRRRRESLGRFSGLDPRLYWPVVLPQGAFMAYMTTALLLPLLIGSRREELTVRNFACLSTVFLHIAFYDALLLMLLPLLRRRVAARSIAALWTVPTVLYLFTYAGTSVLHPLAVLRVPLALARKLGWLWFAGFCAVLLTKTVGHLRFRRAVLKPARQIEEGPVLAVLREEMAAIGQEKLRLVVSPAVRMPVVIGLLKEETVLVLPEREYSEAEQRLIFSHELVHVQRGDAWFKLFLCFCTAMVWFNPLMWVSMARAAEDAELSCDETVLIRADADERRRYAWLILSTAGDARGFSSCLSASALGLRYRLRSIVKPGKKHGGILLLSFAVFLLMVSCGLLSVCIESGTLGERWFGSGEAGSLSAVLISEGGQVRKTICRDPEALTAYLSAIPLEQDGGERPTERNVEILYGDPDGNGDCLAVTLNEHTLRVISRRDGQLSSALYRLYAPPDWSAIEGWIDGAAG